MRCTIPRRDVRGSLARIDFIIRKLMAGGTVNASTLAKEWECTTKTIHRDLEFLTDRLGHDIVYDASRYTFYYRTPAEFYLIPATGPQSALV